MIKNIFTTVLALCISLSAYTQLPTPAIVGYLENWGTGSFIKLKDIDSRYNVINIAFASLKSGTDYHMQFYPAGSYIESDFKAEMAALQSEGKKIIISIGGQNDHVILDTEAEKNTFVSSVNQIVDYWGFDGVDIDLEGTSVHFTDINIQKPGDVKQQLMITAIQEMMANHYTTHGKKMLLTMAPETHYVQGGLSPWPSNYSGAYLPIIEALKDSIDMLNVQLYSSGSMFGLDGQAGGAFVQANADFVLAMTEAVILGFTGGDTTLGIYSGFPASKTGVALPGCHSSDAVPHKELVDAVNYLMGNGPQPGSYTLKTKGGYPDLKGMMTWSINSDKRCSPSYGFVDTYSKIFTDSSYIEIESNGSIYEQLENGGLIQVNLFKDTYASTLDTTNWTVENLPNGVQVDSIIRVNDTTAHVVLKGNSTVKYPSAIWNVKVIADSSQFIKSRQNLSRGNGVILKKTISKIPGTVQCEDLSAKKNVWLINNFFGDTGTVLRFNSNYYSEYEVDISESGTYDVTFRTALEAKTHSSSLKIDGKTIGYQSMSSTTSWKVLETTSTYKVDLDSGFHVLTLFMNSGWMNIDWMNFKKAAPESVKALGNTNNLTISPNPADQIVNIIAESPCSIIILDVTGKVVKSHTQSSTNHQINTSDLTKGLYLVKATSPNGDAFVQRLIIK